MHGVRCGSVFPAQRRRYDALLCEQEIVRTIREGLRRTGGYCPCRLARTEENRCMCREFKDQIADPDYEGYCHCRLYYKEK